MKLLRNTAQAIKNRGCTKSRHPIWRCCNPILAAYKHTEGRAQGFCKEGGTREGFRRRGRECVCRVGGVSDASGGLLTRLSSLWVAGGQVMQGGYGRARRRQEAGKHGVVEDEEDAGAQPQALRMVRQQV